MKRKELLLRKAAVVAGIVVISSLATHIIDKQTMQKSMNEEIAELKQENVIMPCEKWGTITIYNSTEDCIESYTGYLSFTSMPIMGERGVYVNCDEARLLQRMPLTETGDR